MKVLTVKSNKDEVNSLNILRDNDYQDSSQKFRQVKTTEYIILEYKT